MKRFLVILYVAGQLGVACSASAGEIDVSGRRSIGSNPFTPAAVQYRPFTLDGASAEVRAQGKSLSVVVHRNAAATEFKLPPTAAQIASVYQWQDKVVVLSLMDGVGSTLVSTFHPATGESLDSFWAYGVSVSPDRRYIAFRRWVQARGAELMDSQYRLYDLARTPEQNRRNQPTKTPYADDVGAFIYSLAPAEVEREGHELTPGNVHEYLSELVWSDDGRYVGVVDRHGSVASLVVAEPKDDARLVIWSAVLPELGRLCTAVDAGRNCTSSRPVLLGWQGDLVRITVDEVPPRRGASFQTGPTRWIKLKD